MSRFFAVLMLAAIAVVALWIFSPTLLLWVGSHHGVALDLGKTQELGAFGDAFGAINALFSGLVLAVVGLTFLHELRSRRASRSPLVIFAPTDLPTMPLVFFGPVSRGAGVAYPVSLRVKVANAASDPALNVRLEFFLKCAKGSPISFHLPPLPGGGALSGAGVVEVAGEIESAGMLAIANCVQSGAALVLVVSAEYSNIDNYYWTATCEFKVDVAVELKSALLTLIPNSGSTGSTWVHSREDIGVALSPLSGSWGVTASSSRPSRLWKWLKMKFS